MSSSHRIALRIGYVDDEGMPPDITLGSKVIVITDRDDPQAQNFHDARLPEEHLHHGMQHPLRREGSFCKK